MKSNSIPEPVQLLLSLLVEDQFDQRSIVAPVPHHVVISRAQQTPLVLRIVGEEAAALADIEDVRENGAEARERGFILFPLAVRERPDPYRRPATSASGRPQRVADSCPSPGYRGISGATSGGSLSMRRAARSKSRRCALNCAELPVDQRLRVARSIPAPPAP